MNFILSRKYLVTIIKYALLLGFVMAVFFELKQVLYNTDSWEIYATIVAALFLAGGIWLGRTHTRDENAEPTIHNHIHTQPSIDTLLSRRETEVLEKLLQRKTNTQIADEMCIELSTLKTHINKIYKKLEVKNRSELAAKCKNYLLASI